MIIVSSPVGAFLACCHGDGHVGGVQKCGLQLLPSEQSRVPLHIELTAQLGQQWLDRALQGIVNLTTATKIQSICIQLQNNRASMFSSSGWMVISEGLPHICLGTGPTGLSRGHWCELLCALPGYSGLCFIVFHYKYLAKIYTGTVLKYGIKLWVEDRAFCKLNSSVVYIKGQQQVY